MPIVRNNPLLQGVSGMLGNNVVYRQRKGQTIMANKPKKRKGLSEKQQSTVDRFRYATHYAKECMKLPEHKAMYARGINDKKVSAYAVAFSDHMNPPKIEEIDIKDYNGRAGDIIRVRATDDFKVLSVRVEVRDTDGNLIEEGNAEGRGKRGLWRFIASVGSTTIKGFKVIAEAKDVASNATVKEISAQLS